MKIKSLLIAVAFAGGILSSASATTTDAHTKVAATLVKFEAPVPVKVIQPIMLPTRHAGSTVTLSMTIDAAGKPHNVRVMSTNDQDAYRRMVDTVSQWEFTPGRKNGVPVSTRIELPLEVVGG